MTYVKKGAMIFFVEDDKVPKYTNDGFEVFVPGSPEPIVPKEGTETEKKAKAEAKAKKAAEKKAAQEAPAEVEAETVKGDADAEITN